MIFKIIFLLKITDCIDIHLFVILQTINVAIIHLTGFEHQLASENQRGG